MVASVCLLILGTLIWLLLLKNILNSCMLMLAWTSLAWTSFGTRNSGQWGYEFRWWWNCAAQKGSEMTTSLAKKKIAYFLKKYSNHAFISYLSGTFQSFDHALIQTNLWNILMRCQTDVKKDKNYSPLNLSKEEIIRCRDNFTSLLSPSTFRTAFLTQPTFVCQYLLSYEAENF